MRYIVLFVCLLSLFGCAATTIDCDDATQVLSKDPAVREKWIKECSDENRKVKVNGTVQE